MSTSQLRISIVPKQDDYPIRARRFAILIGLGLLGYYGYCFGLWGRNSLFLQFLFQCGCPSFSEDWRYPKEVDVIVSACHYDDVILSPSGRLIYAQKRNSLITPSYLLNLQTHEKTPLALGKGSIHFLTDELIFHSFHGNDLYILDITTGIKYPIQDARRLQPRIYSMGDVEPSLLIDAFLRVDQIFFIDDLFHPVVALSSNFRSHPENSFTFDSLNFPGDDPDRVENFLQQNNIAYSHVPGIYSTEILSPDARFIARPDGIYLTKTNQLIVELQNSLLKGWIYDGRGAIYTSNECLFLLSLPGLDMSCLASVPQPVILLKVPEEYLSSTPTP